MRSTNTFPRSTWLIALAFASACDPGGASPMPEPPAMDLGKVSAPNDVVALVWPEPVKFVAQPGAAVGADFVRVTDLDSKDPPIVTTVAPDGSFSVSLFVSPNDVVRFQAVSDQARGEPRDATYTPDKPLVPVVRPACIELDPGYHLDFTGPSSQRITVKNSCTAAVTLGAVTTRLALPDFTVTATPGAVAVGGTTEVTVAFSRAGNDEREEVVFMPIDVAGASVRFPVTVYAPAVP